MNIIIKVFEIKKKHETNLKNFNQVNNYRGWKFMAVYSNA